MLGHLVDGLDALGAPGGHERRQPAGEAPHVGDGDAGQRGRPPRPGVEDRRHPQVLVAQQPVPAEGAEVDGVPPSVLGGVGQVVDLTTQALDLRGRHALRQA